MMKEVPIRHKQRIYERFTSMSFDFIKKVPGQGVRLGIYPFEMLCFVELSEQVLAPTREENFERSRSGALTSFSMVDYVADMLEEPRVDSVPDVTPHDLDRIVRGDLLLYGQREKKNGFFFQATAEGVMEGLFHVLCPPEVRTAEWDGSVFWVLSPYSFVKKKTIQGYDFVPHKFETVTSSRDDFKEGIIFLTSEGEKRMKRVPTVEVRDPVGRKGIFECSGSPLIVGKERPYKVPDPAAGRRLSFIPSYKYFHLEKPILPWRFEMEVAPFEYFRNRWATYETPWMDPRPGTVTFCDDGTPEVLLGFGETSFLKTVFPFGKFVNGGKSGRKRSVALTQMMPHSRVCLRVAVANWKSRERIKAKELFKEEDPEMDQIIEENDQESNWVDGW